MEHLKQATKNVMAWPKWKKEAAGLSESTETPGCAASPWPARDVVEKLVEATDILLNEKDYDGHGWEEIVAAQTVAKSWLAA